MAYHKNSFLVQRHIFVIVQTVRLTAAVYGRYKIVSYNFYRCTVHFEIYVVQSPRNAPFINLVKSFKFTLKYTITSLLHVSVFNDHHQVALSVPDKSYIYA